MPAVPFILDTDTAQDDCVAIMLGVLDPAADLRAITMVAGNVGFERQVTNAHLTLQTLGAIGQVPVHLGSDRPLMRPWVSAANVHGDGAGGLELTDEVSVDPEPAVQALLRLTAEQPGEISVVAIGPLTNIAAAVLSDRDFASRVKSLYVMGGSNNGRGNITPAAEFNFYVDPEAAQIVMDAGFADLQVFVWDPLTLTSATFDRTEYAALGAHDTDLARFFTAVCDTTLEFNDSVGISGSTHPDSLTLAALLHPELVLRRGAYRVDVECASDLTRGYSAMSWSKFGLEPNAAVIEQIDRDAFYGLLDALVAGRLGRGDA